MGALHFQSVRNMARAAMNPAKAQVMLTKAWLRFFDNKAELVGAEYKDWLKANAIPTSDFLKRFPDDLQTETKLFMEGFNAHVKSVWDSIPHRLGGGGNVPLLYMLARSRKPQTIIETGVASGISSAGFLNALKRNGSGKLYSSDFPYFRLENPEQYVGVVVEPSLKADWSLYLKGDDINLPEILAQVGQVDLFHYDSDKSYAGRQRAVDLIRPRLSPDGLIVVDDIQDNGHFYDLTRQSDAPWLVLEYKGKYVGLIGRV